MNAPSDPAPPAPRRGRARDLLRNAVVLAIVIAALAFLGWQLEKADPARVARLVAGAGLAGSALVVLWTLARFVVAGLRLGLVTRRLMPCGVLGFVPISLASHLVGLAIPGLRAGQPLFRALLAHRRYGGGVSTHLGPNLLDQLFNALGWVLVAGALLPLMAGRESALPGSLSLAIVAALGLFALAYGLLRWRGSAAVRWLSRPRSGRRGRVAEVVGTTVSGAERLSRDPIVALVGVTGSVLFVLATAAAQHAALEAVGAPSPFALALFTVALGGIAGSASGAPGGLGVTEAAQVAFLVAEGVPQSEAAAAVLLARGAHYAVIVTCGGAALLVEAISGRLGGVLSRARSSLPRDATS